MIENAVALTGLLCIVVAVGGLVGHAFGLLVGLLVAVLVVGLALVWVAKVIHDRPESTP